MPARPTWSWSTRPAWTTTAPWPLDDLAGSRAHVRGLGRGGLLDADEVGELLDALDQVESELDSGDVHLRPRRRGHPHRRRAAGHRDRRRRRSQAAHRAQPQRPDRHRPPAVHQTRAAERWPRRSSPSRRCCCAGPRRRVTPTFPATPTCSGPNRCCWPITCWPTAGRCPGTSTGCWPPWTARRVAPRGRGAGRIVAAARPRRCGRRARVRAAGSRTRLDAVSDRDFVAEALFDLALLGVHLSRIGEEIVLWSTEEFGFAASTTPMPPAARCCRRRRTPTWPSWPGARRAASSAT